MNDYSIKYILDFANRYNFPYESAIIKGIKESVELIINAYENNGKMLVCGNGGSAADSLHIAGELAKGFIKKRPINDELKEKLKDDFLASILQEGLPCISLVNEVALLTAYANDCCFETAFAQQVLVYGQKDDVLLCISTSGNSVNCVYAAKVAKALGLSVISLTGENDSKLSELSDCTIKVPSCITHIVQEFHLPIYHTICLTLEDYFYKE